jgi:hypothetical protein
LDKGLWRFIVKTLSEASFSGGSDALLEHRPEMMAKLGLIAANWAEVEEALALLFAWLLGQNGEPGEFGQPVDALGIEFFHEIPSSYQRLKMARRSTEHRLSEGLQEAFKKDVIPVFEKAGKCRNLFLHNRLGVDERYPYALVMNPLVGELCLIEEKDLTEALEAIAVAKNAVWMFNKQARDEIKAKYQKTS